jgi:hypothetical protein
MKAEQPRRTTHDDGTGSCADDVLLAEVCKQAEALAARLDVVTRLASPGASECERIPLALAVVIGAANVTAHADCSVQSPARTSLDLVDVDRAVHHLNVVFITEASRPAVLIAREAYRSARDLPALGARYTGRHTKGECALAVLRGAASGLRAALEVGCEDVARSTLVRLLAIPPAELVNLREHHHHPANLTATAISLVAQATPPFDPAHR